MSETPNRAAGTIWCLSRRDLGTYVRTEVNDHIVIGGRDWTGQPTALYLSRRDARLLAKRINQCLDDTAKR